MINKPDPPVIITPLTSPLATKSQCWTEDNVAETYFSNIDCVIMMVMTHPHCSQARLHLLLLIVVTVHERLPNT
jgi:hypothetical protein